ncbi:MAG: hypothetical protein ABI537_08925 [Casimicrobiaceae bacterium]
MHRDHCLAAWIAASLVNRAIRAFRERIAQGLAEPEQVKRAETIGRVFRYLVSVILSLIAGVLILSELGVSIAPILGAAGVVGLAIGFGAQSLVNDYFTGIFVLLKNQLTTGDVYRFRTSPCTQVSARTVRRHPFGWTRPKLPAQCQRQMNRTWQGSPAQ